MPTRNRLESLRRALNSLNRQTYRDFELWVVDDGSTDDTRSFVASGRLQRDYPGIPSIHVLSNDVCRGAAASRNRAMQQACGEFIAFLDDDDAWRPEYLERQVHCLEAHGEAVASYANYVHSGLDGRLHVPDIRPLFDYDNSLIHLLTEAFVHSMSVFFCRRTAIESAGLMDEALVIVHDWEWYSRILLPGASMIALGGPPLVHRSGPGGLVSGHRKWYAEECQVLERACRDNPTVAGARRQILAHRALFFAGTALRRHDFVFAVKCLAESFASAPARALQIAIRRLYRNLRARRSTMGEEGFGHE